MAILAHWSGYSETSIYRIVRVVTGKRANISRYRSSHVSAPKFLKIHAGTQCLFLLLPVAGLAAPKAGKPKVDPAQNPEEPKVVPAVLAPKPEVLPPKVLLAAPKPPPAPIVVLAAPKAGAVAP